MTRPKFESREEISRLWKILDGIARKAWEPLEPTDPRRKKINDAAGQFFTELRSRFIDLPAAPSSISVEPPHGVNADANNWEQFALEDLLALLGREDVNSVTEAYLKAVSLLRVLEQTTHGGGHNRFLFRGQRKISWDLVSRKGRELRDSEWVPPSTLNCENGLTIILAEELESLAEFQLSWNSLVEVDPLDRLKELPHDHAEWWFLMQHYDNGAGTRLLDISTSLNAAMLFACIDWSTGLIDDTEDGAVYMWPEGYNANVDDFLIKSLPASAEEMFRVHEHAPRMILNPPHNERSKAQSGGFIWWPRFWENPPYSRPHYLRINKSAKESIVRDLLSLGVGPKEVVRGDKGLENEKNLRESLGLPSFNPIALTVNNT